MGNNNVESGSIPDQWLKVVEGVKSETVSLQRTDDTDAIRVLEVKLTASRVPTTEWITVR